MEKPIAPSVSGAWIRSHKGKAIASGLLVGSILGGIGVWGVLHTQTVSAGTPGGLEAITAAYPPSDGELTDRSSTDDVIGMLVSSHNRWRTADVTATTVWLPGTGDEQKVETHLVVGGNGQANLQTLQHDARGNLMFDISWVSDGKSILEGDVQRNLFTQSMLPDSFLDVHTWGPLDVVNDGAILPHPMALLIPSKLAQYLYPTELAQQAGDWKIEGADTVAERKAVVAFVSYRDNQGAPAGSARYWIDTSTGVILRAQQWVPGEAGMYQETVIQSVSFDVALAPETFSVAVTDPSRLVSSDEFRSAP